MGAVVVMDMDAAFAAAAHLLAAAHLATAAHAIRAIVTALDAMVHAITATAPISLRLEADTEEIRIKAREAAQKRTTIIARAITHVMVVDITTTITATTAKLITLALPIAAHAQIQAAATNKLNYKAAFSNCKSRFFISTPPLNSPIDPLLRMIR